MRDAMIAVIQRGALGVSSNVICGAMAHGQLCTALHKEVTRAASDALLAELGYVRAFSNLRWLGSNHTIWLRNGFACSASEAKRVLNVTGTPPIQPYVTIQG